MLRGAWLSVVDAYLLWLVAAGCTAGTVRLRRYYLVRLAQRHPHPWRVSEADLIEFLATEGWAAETRKSARSSVRSFYGWASTVGRIRDDPSRDLPPVRPPAGMPRPAPRQVIAAALAKAGRRERLMVLLAVLAGLRRGEIAGLHTDDITDDGGGPALRVRGKGGRVRLVPLHRMLAAEMARVPAGFVFPGAIDGHLSPLWVGKLLSRLLGPGWSAHTLRHRFATDAAAGGDLLAVQRLLGHSKPETTIRYTQIGDTALRSATDHVGDWVA
jgi:integrase